MSERDPWRLVLADLRRRIQTGAFPPPGRLPTMNALMAEYGVTSRPAMQKVLAQLAADGLITTVPRHGSFVRRYDRIPWLVGPPSLDGSSAPNDRTAATSTHADAPAIEQAPPDIERRLRTTPVSVTRWTHVVDGVPAQIAAMYTAAEGSRSVPLPEPSDESSAAPRHLRCVDEIRARMPSPEESDRLELPPGTPVAEHVRTWFASGTPNQIVVTVTRGDAHTLVYEFPEP